MTWKKRDSKCRIETELCENGEEARTRQRQKTWRSLRQSVVAGEELMSLLLMVTLTSFLTAFMFKAQQIVTSSAIRLWAQLACSFSCICQPRSGRSVWKHDIRGLILSKKRVLKCQWKEKMSCTVCCEQGVGQQDISASLAMFAFRLFPPCDCPPWRIYWKLLLFCMWFQLVHALVW